MKRLMLLSAGLVFGMLPAALVQTGSMIIDPATVHVCSQPAPTVESFGTREVLKNGDFEKGTLPPWTSNVWKVDTVNPHGGQYCACDVGNYFVEQVFSPIPASIVQHVTFWARQPDQPAAQAYDFLYDDGSSSEFLQFPRPDWGQFDITANLNRSKNLKGIRIWGYSGGGPGPDSTYVDDASITRMVDVTVSPSGPAPGETIPLNSQLVLLANVRNNGPVTESLYLWARIQRVVRLDDFVDSAWVVLLPTQSALVTFSPWTASDTGLYRWQVTADSADTTWHYFYVDEGSDVNQPSDFPSLAGIRLLTPSIGRAFAWQNDRTCDLRVYNSAGKLVYCTRGTMVLWSGAATPAGVYTAYLAGRRYRLVIPEP
jgi:hypothetical protein